LTFQGHVTFEMCMAMDRCWKTERWTDGRTIGCSQ